MKICFRLLDPISASNGRKEAVKRKIAQMNPKYYGETPAANAAPGVSRGSLTHMIDGSKDAANASFFQSHRFRVFRCRRLSVCRFFWRHKASNRGKKSRRVRMPAFPSRCPPVNFRISSFFVAFLFALISSCESMPIPRYYVLSFALGSV